MILFQNEHGDDSLDTMLLHFQQNHPLLQITEQYDEFPNMVNCVTTGLKWNHFNRLKQNRSDLWAHYGASV